MTSQHSAEPRAPATTHSSAQLPARSAAVALGHVAGGAAAGLLAGLCILLIAGPFGVGLTTMLLTGTVVGGALFGWRFGAAVWRALLDVVGSLPNGY